jgi:hypothetical protein
MIGYFNLMRKPEDRNKPGGNLSEMMEFNAAIGNQRLEELKLNGAKYTWTNTTFSSSRTFGLVLCLCILADQLSWIFCEHLV